MKQYKELVSNILSNGQERENRTGTNTRGIFGTQHRYNLQDGFPLVTTKKVNFKAVVAELLWFLSGSTNVNDLDSKIWNDWRQPYTTNRKLVSVEPKQPSASVAYTGNYSVAGVCASRGSVDERLASAWVKMMKRCYDPTAHNYSFYGGRGTSVHPNWHSVSTFLFDVKRLPHWWYKEHSWNDYELDKDYFSSNQYGPETCIWLSSAENNLYTSATKVIRVTDSEGRSKTYLGSNACGRALSMPGSSMSRFVGAGRLKGLKANNRQFTGWLFEEEDSKTNNLRLESIPEGELGPVYGSQFRSWGGRGIDQIQQAIHTIKTNPTSRRIIVSAWNPTDVPKMALPPCHLMFQFYVRPMIIVGNRGSFGGYLDCQMYQRSADVALGVPFNIASYALLMHLIANECNLLPGEFVHTIGDAHAYINHIEGLKMQMMREPRPSPTLELPRGKPVDEINTEDIVLGFYDHHPAIKFKVAV